MIRVITSTRYDDLLTKAALSQTFEDLVINLQGQITRLTEEVTRERLRAEQAIDAMLAMKGAPPVTPHRLPQEDDPFSEDPAEVERLHKAISTEGLGHVIEEEQAWQARG